MESNPLECAICYNLFSQKNTPRNLPCSHTFCGPCINGIIATQKKTCPSCRVKFTAASAEDLMINRSLLLVVEQFGSVKPKTLSKGQTGSFAELPKESGNKLTDKKFQEKETRVFGELKILKEMKNVFAAAETLREMKDGVLDTQKDLRRFKTKLREIELSNEQILEKIKKGEANLQTATDLTLTKPYQDADEKVNKIRDVVLETQRERDDITKDIVTMRKKLGRVVGEIEKAFGVDPPVISAEGDFPPGLAAKVIEGKKLVAPVRVNQVQLSRFKEGDVPPKSLIINHEALMKTPSRRAFLDLAIKGSRLGRLVIKVIDGGNLALNFLHLCAGDLGPSYADSHLSEVERKGLPGEHIRVDGYITSGDTIRKAAVTKVDWNIERQNLIYHQKRHKVGEVRGLFSDDEASQFYIVTKDDPNLSFSIDNNCFGIVEEGLDVLTDAILQYPNISDLRIVDCGLLMMSE